MDICKYPWIPQYPWITRLADTRMDMERTQILYYPRPWIFIYIPTLNRWLGVVVVVPPGDVMLSYVQFVGSGRNRKIRKGFSSVWLVFVWVIWKARNDRIFNNVNGEVEVAVECIQCIS
jgi:hypothetical protein